jgi:hypothetical protein
VPPHRSTAVAASGRDRRKCSLTLSTSRAFAPIDYRPQPR